MSQQIPVADGDVVLAYSDARDSGYDLRRAILVGGVLFTFVKAIEMVRRTIHAFSIAGLPSHAVAWTVIGTASWLAMFAACFATWRGWTSNRFLRIALIVTCIGTQLHEAIELPHEVFPVRPGDGVRSAAFLVMVSCSQILAVYWPIVMIVCLGHARVTLRRLIALATLYGALLTLCEGTGVVHHWLSYHAWPGNMRGEGRLALIEQICDEVGAVVTLIVFLLAIVRFLPPLVATCIATLAALSPLCVGLISVAQFTSGTDMPMAAWYQTEENLTYCFTVYFLLWMLIRRRHDPAVVST